MDRQPTCEELKQETEALAKETSKRKQAAEALRQAAMPYHNPPVM